MEQIGFGVWNSARLSIYSVSVIFVTQPCPMCEMRQSLIRPTQMYGDQWRQFEADTSFTSFHLYPGYLSLVDSDATLSLGQNRAHFTINSGGHLLSTSTTDNIGSFDTRLRSFFCLLYLPMFIINLYSIYHAIFIFVSGSVIINGRAYLLSGHYFFF